VFVSTPEVDQSCANSFLSCFLRVLYLGLSAGAGLGLEGRFGRMWAKPPLHPTLWAS
jgi:hypothetical protein